MAVSVEFLVTASIKAPGMSLSGILQEFGKVAEVNNVPPQETSKAVARFLDSAEFIKAWEAAADERRENEKEAERGYYMDKLWQQYEQRARPPTKFTLPLGGKDAAALNNRLLQTLRNLEAHGMGEATLGDMERREGTLDAIRRDEAKDNET